MKKRLLVVTALFLVSVSCARAVDDVVYVDVDRPDVAAFIDEMVAKHGFEDAELRALIPVEKHRWQIQIKKLQS